MQIIFIGGGNMAEAIFSRLENGSHDVKLNIVVIQHNLDKRTRLSAQYPNIRFLPSLNFTPTADDIIILAVKPQDAKNTCLSLPKISGTIVSVMAGVNTNTLSRWLNSNKITRVMPNTAAKLGLSVNGIFYLPKVPLKYRQIIESVMSYIGKNHIVNDEDSINKITAIASSSPAYVFYFIEALIDSAVNKFGFSDADAHDITLQVLKSSIAMIEGEVGTPIKQLRANISSKKGTTEQAIHVFEKANLKQIVLDAQTACYDRAKELARIIDTE